MQPTLQKWVTCMHKVSQLLADITDLACTDVQVTSAEGGTNKPAVISDGRKECTNDANDSDLLLEAACDSQVSLQIN